MPVILLNGTSSAGKTSIARAIQKSASTPFVYAAIDTFIDMFNLPGIGFSPEVRVECIVTGISLMHRSLPALASSRFPVIVDHVLEEPSWYDECQQFLRGHRVLFVGVHCPIEILCAREQARGDRQIGLAERQFTRVHRYRPYDIEVNTANTSPEECAKQILALFDASLPDSLSGR